MPLYEYRCTKCRKRFTVLTLRIGAPVDPVCEHCGSRAAEKLLSRFAMPRSEEERLERLSDPSTLEGLDENDPRSVARWMRKVGKEMGEDFGGEEFDQIMEEIEAGEGEEESGRDAGEEGGEDV
ncbi:MAG: FmdB family transcriptional regulator [Candidatus Binatia bacterium]|nr:MAG: FmdB family transcriptional regulator [Candidatus Binatia bacterium]